MTTAEPPLNYSFFKYQQTELGIFCDTRKHPACAKRPPGMTAVILPKWTKHKNGDPANGLGFVVSC